MTRPETDRTRRVSVLAPVFTLLLASVFTTSQCLLLLLQVVFSVLTMLQLVAPALKLRVLELEVLVEVAC